MNEIIRKIKENLPQFFLNFIFGNDQKISKLRKAIRKPNQQNQDWRLRLARNKKKLFYLQLLKILKIAMLVVVPLALAVAVLVFSISGLAGFVPNIPRPVRIIISVALYMVLIFAVIWLFYFLYRRVLLLFGIRLVEDDTDTLYHQIRDIVYNAIDNEIVSKVGLYYPSSPNNLRPISYDIYEVNGVNMFNVVFSKYKHMEIVDTHLFQKLLERNMKRLRNSNKFPLAFTDPILYRGKQYEPLLLMNITQDTDNVNISIVIANETSIDMFIRSQQVSGKRAGALYDED